MHKEKDVEEKKTKIVFQEVSEGLNVSRYFYSRADKLTGKKAGTRLVKLNVKPIPLSIASNAKKEELNDFFDKLELDLVDSVLIERLKLYANYVLADRKLRDRVSKEEALAKIKELMQLADLKPEQIK